MPAQYASRHSANLPIFFMQNFSRQNLLGKPKTSIEALTDTLEELEMDDKARNRIKVFLNQKEKIGELRDEDLEKMGELGSGNGGVVMKGECKHAVVFQRSLHSIFELLKICFPIHRLHFYFPFFKQSVTCQPNG